MEIILILFGIATLVWFMAFQRHLTVIVGALLVLLVGITFGHPFFNVSAGPVPITIDRVLLGWLVLASLVLWKLGRMNVKPINRTDIVVMLWIAALIASTAMHDFKYKENLPLSRLLFFNMLPLCFYFVAKQCRVTKKDLRVFLTVLVVFGAYLGLTAIFEQRNLYALVYPRFITDPQHWEFLGRARGPFLNPVSCGVFLSVCMVAAALKWPTTHPLGRVLLVSVFGICLLASVLTLTRSVWVACLVCVGLVVWLPAKMHHRGVLIVAGTLMLVVAAATMSDRLSTFKRDKDVSEAEMAQSAKLRPMLAFVAYKMVRDKPVFGHGFGQYTRAKKPYHYNQTNGMQLSKVLPYMQHNVFLSYLTETGFAGFGLLCTILAILAFRSFQLWNCRRIPLEERLIGILSLAVLVHYGANGMFHDVSIIEHVNALLFLMLGLSENLTSRLAEQQNTLTGCNENPGEVVGSSVNVNQSQNQAA